MRSTGLEKCLESYLVELRQREGLDRILEVLAREFLPGIACLARYGFAGIRELQGELGQELLHELVCAILESRLPSDPVDGDILRALGRIAYRRLRRGQRHLQTNDAAAPQCMTSGPVGQVTTTPIEDSNNIPVSLRELLRQVQDPENLKGEGSLHYARVGQAMKLDPKRLRLELRKLGGALGRGKEHETFWLNRLRERLVELLRLRTEALAPDLLSRSCSNERLVRRLQRVLSQLSHARPDANARRALRIVRRMERERSYPREPLREAALLLRADPLVIHITDAECLLACARAKEALDLLTPLSRPADPRKRLVLALTRARCLEASGRFLEASNLLEEAAALQRTDALFCYNRLVLALQAGLPERLSRATAELEQIMAGAQKLSPRLLARIRIARQRAQQVLAADS